MQLIIITPETFMPAESTAITALLMAGADRIHIRKPGASEAEVGRLIEQIPARFHASLSLHDHFALLTGFPDLAVHLNRRNGDLPASYAGRVSRSCHALTELTEQKAAADYLFLSPVFNSISKAGYASAFPPEVLRQAAADGIIDSQVVALGGVKADNIGELKPLGFGGVALLGDIWNRYRRRDDLTEVLRHTETVIRRLYRG